jgi:hypothetical protein
LAFATAAICRTAPYPGAGRRRDHDLPAHASEIDCNGYRYGMKVCDLVTLDINDKMAPACDIPNNGRAWSQIKDWCNDDDLCTFGARKATLRQQVYDRSNRRTRIVG